MFYVWHELLFAYRRINIPPRFEESCGVIRCDFFRREVNVRRKLQATLSDISPRHRGMLRVNNKNTLFNSQLYNEVLQS